MKNIPLVIQLQNDAADLSIPVATLLRKAKIISSKLDLDDLSNWIDKELNGYFDCNTEDLPKYRLIQGEFKAYNPYHGWQPIFFKNAEEMHKLAVAPVADSISVLEERAKDTNATYKFQLPPGMAKELQEGNRYRLEVQLLISAQSFLEIINIVRNTILEWALKLEKEGILDENFEFQEKDKSNATHITNIIAQNIAQVGNSYDDSSITTTQIATSTNIKIEDVKNLIDEIEKCKDILPDEAKRAIETEIEKVKEQTKKNPGEEDISLIKKSLGFIKSICIQATGNVAAQGILQIINRILGT